MYKFITTLSVLSMFITTAYSHDKMAVKGEASYTYINDDKDNEYYVQQKPGKVTVNVDITKYIGDNIDAYMVLSNRLYNTVLDRAIVKYTNVSGSLINTMSIGTHSTLRGVFDKSKSSVEQPPMINLPSGVYNDEWMSGLLDSVVGLQYSAATRYGAFLYTASYTVGKLRITDKTKAEEAVFNYESEYVDIEQDNYMRTLELEAYSSNFTVFMSTNMFKLKTLDRSGMTDTEKMMMYITNPNKFDPIILTISNTPYKLTINRLGATYSNNTIVIGAELDTIHTTHKGPNIDVYNRGWYIYSSLVTNDVVTPYISYSSSDHSRSQERVIGLRASVGDVTLLTEYKKTDWVQTRTMEDYNNATHNMHVISAQCIYRF